MSTPQHTRCAIYTRKSTSKGLEQRHNSLDAQEDRCRSYIAIRDHYTHIHTYSDAGISGATTQRPALKQLLADAKLHKFDIVFPTLFPEEVSSGALVSNWHAICLQNRPPRPQSTRLSQHHRRAQPTRR